MHCQAYPECGLGIVLEGGVEGVQKTSAMRSLRVSWTLCIGWPVYGINMARSEIVFGVVVLGEI